MVSLSGTVGSCRRLSRNLCGTRLPSSKAGQQGPKNARRFEMSFLALLRVRVAIMYWQIRFCPPADC